MNHSAPRENYLRALGIKRDPFATPVAELELNSQDPYSSFYSYFAPVSPFPNSNDRLPLEILRDSNHAFVYGATGSGKTALRLAFEENIRKVFDKTFVTTFALDRVREVKWTRALLAQALAREMALDGFVQIVEQFSRQTNPLTPKQKRAFQYQFQGSGCQLSRVVELMLDQSKPEGSAGIGAHFPNIGRHPVRSVEATPKLLQFLRASRPTHRIQKRSANAATALRREIQSLHNWGFERILILVDPVDSNIHTTDAFSKQESFNEWQIGFLNLLLQELNPFEEQNVFVKFFLPPELQPHIAETLRRNPLKTQPFETTITWTPNTLRQVLERRFRGVGARYTGFDSFASHELQDRLDELIIQSAHGSPQRMLYVASSLIDAHAFQESEKLNIRLQDWHAMRRDWQYGDPSPMTITS